MHVWAGDQSNEPSGVIEVEAGVGGAVMRLVGDVDAAVVQECNGDQVLEQHEIVAVDVRELGYIDSTGLSLLVRWAIESQAAGRPAVVRHAGRRFERVLEMAGLTELFDPER